MTDAELIAAFLAKKAPTVVAEGAGLGLTNRQWYGKVRDPKTVRPSHRNNAEWEAFDDENRSERAMEAFQDARMSGASMETAMDDYNFERNR